MDRFTMPSEAAIIEFLRNNPDSSRAQIRADIAPDSSEATVWRALRGLVEKGALSVVGKGPATRYNLAGVGRVRAHTPRQAGRTAARLTLALTWLVALLPSSRLSYLRSPRRAAPHEFVHEPRSFMNFTCPRRVGALGRGRLPAGGHALGCWSHKMARSSTSKTKVSLGPIMLAAPASP